MNNYYVYLYWRLDTNEIFYVGKGHNDRWKRLKRHNPYFNSIVNKRPIVVEIVKDNLTESEAFYWEEEIIRILVFEYGYSIDVENNKSLEKGCHLVNCTWGGEGISGWKHSEETLEKVVKNRNYKHGEELSSSKMVVCLNTNEIFKCIRYAEEKYNAHDISRCCKKRKGRNSSGRYNNESLVWRYLEDYLIMTIEDIKSDIKLGQLGNDTKPRKVICLTTMMIFDTISKGAKYYKIDNSGLAKHCKGKNEYAGKLNNTPLKWMYLDDFLKKCNYTIL